MKLSKKQAQEWLLKYAWAEDSDDAKVRVVECIMSQDGWRYIDAMADKYAGAQNEPGPAAFSEGVQFALSALYECHDGPHLTTCPNFKCPCCAAHPQAHHPTQPCVSCEHTLSS